MLRNTRIRTRLALMAFAPALTALILLGITFALVPSISIGGSAYDQIVVGKDFQKGTVSPSLYIIEVHSLVQEMVVIANAGADYQQQRDNVTKARQQYEIDYRKWAIQTPLKDPDALANLNTSYKYAEEYFNDYDHQLLPALAAHNAKLAEDTLEFTMVGALTNHRIAIQAAADEVGQQVAAREQDADARVQQQMLGIIGVTLVLMAASIAIGITVLRSITERVRRLNEVATVELPHLLEEVQRAAANGEEIPSLPHTGAEGSDELSTAAEAFNAVVATAVEMAAEQSQLRRSTSQMFINLGRRNHKLLSRTLTYITQLESDERDPSTLQNLFRLDHLATRMRRHAESLLVLAGSPPLRTWSRPVPVADVLRAALSEIETYDRVDIKELEPVEVRGASVSDLAHLIAELLENATAFSPPQTRVRVLGRADGDGYTIVVVDEGIGMSPEELAAGNALIQNAEKSGFLGDSRMLGLGVVGRLAARHGFKINLTASPVGGVVAWVTLPASALAPRRGAVEPEPLGAAMSPALPGRNDYPGGRSDQGARSGYAGAAAGGSETRALSGSGTLPMQSSPVPANGRSAPSGLASPSGAAPVPTAHGGAPSGASGYNGESGYSGGSGHNGGSGYNGAPSPGMLRPESLPLRPAGPARPAPAAPTAPGSPSAPDGPRAWSQPPAGPVHGSPAQAPSGTNGRYQGGYEAGYGAGAPTGPFAMPSRPAAAPPAAHVQRSRDRDQGTGPIPLPPLPDEAAGNGPIAFRKPPAGPGGSGLTRRVRGAQLPDTGEAANRQAGQGASQDRPDRSAQSVRGALASFTAGRRTASEVAIGNAADLKRPEPRVASSSHLGDPITQPVVSAGTVRQAEAPGPILPRRVRGAQMPQTDLPTSAPAPERSAAEVRAALSNFVTGRRAAEHED